ncbi:MAG: hypothetical protein AAB152_12265 [Candidatus Coatesbacteria bacterium]
MATGMPGGRYEEEAKKLLRELRASGLILVVLDGPEGNGVHVVVDESRGGLTVVGSVMAKMLRNVADNLERDSGAGVEA